MSNNPAVSWLCTSLFVVVAGWLVTSQAATEMPDFSPQEIKGALKVIAEEVFSLFEKPPDIWS